jgi:hypothetical protein
VLSQLFELYSTKLLVLLKQSLFFAIFVFFNKVQHYAYKTNCRLFAFPGACFFPEPGAELH